MRRIIVAIDGPAASGKSTTAKFLAEKLGYIYIDTGAMYRACALQAKLEGFAIDDLSSIIPMLERIDIKISYSESGNIIWLNGRDVSQQIRTPEISAAASKISAIPSVRYKMVELQRKLGKDGGVVLEGRDIGTFVFPEAEAKFFMVADLEVRARRRYQELKAKGIESRYEDVLQELKARDEADASRSLAPLKPASDAILVDTSNLSIEEQVNKLYEITLRKIAELGESNSPNNSVPDGIEVYLAHSSGYCFGVKRAIQMAREAKVCDKPVYTLGEIIHNPGIVQELEEKGIHVANNVSDLKDSTVIIRSHGITREEYETLQKNNNEIIDATCPYVKRTHTILQKMTAEGYPVVIFGDKHHPEVIGLRSFGNDKTIVVAEDEPLPKINENSLVLIAQTTQKIEKLNELVCKLLPNVFELRVFNTICLTTTLRQKATIEMAKKSDVVIVIGGYKSSNTSALAKLSSQYCPTFHIENEMQLAGVDLSKYKRIGLTAGASTPEEMIIKVYNVILQKSGHFSTVKSIEEIPLFKEESC
ncbi:MAG TPA: 4-hydroxy-3-methylbut-2-enyl diphosphate reductase [Candidatus Cloacimonas sp.]|jgi:(E)-4-hydroxy-3-methyl-but-2-enyl pyrophosphate reductase/cytidylate kinase|nr:4-hydroxy-3-methylbut-2-enyl diphosphate reductase [Candidatus Cloacimonas sp.]MDD2249916.1 4-hydroxy-3-methylbut-2-enyl diphosphate reductase [Candidatus Cloacimonadota bacterium]MDD3733708.1 4-hydroxy-3-methylbut-2-enyl diphosphate reductase [Candidatus Cloacimonadota bacterium]MDD3868917.1 4-hydroxy-3-methylbut-2-enyl diphosphate reductase [Candidatus Cloacimonadota bacterium]MDD4676358.1 4-hydroxy-3-methylbut-2-enyl diphosphate reductase [Candidatus Cloacimonadota bacterium]